DAHGRRHRPASAAIVVAHVRKQAGKTAIRSGRGGGRQDRDLWPRSGSVRNASVPARQAPRFRRFRGRDPGAQWRRGRHRRTGAGQRRAPAVELSASMSSEQNTYEYWLGARETKYSLSGVERTVRPGVTIKRARAVLEAIGVTKVADVTDLDRVGIPNFMTVRPHDRGPGLSYYNGKGRTVADAHAGALMEAIERHAGERYDGRIVRSSYYNLRDEHVCVDPLEIQAPLIGGYSEDLLLEWASGFDLLGRRPIFVPLNCVVAPYESFACAPVFFSSTNGLASGNTRLEALCHALCEVVERDAMALALAKSAVR